MTDELIERLRKYIDASERMICSEWDGGAWPEPDKTCGNSHDEARELLAILDSLEEEPYVPDIHQYIGIEPGPLCPCPGCCAKYGPL